jgi:hypothetical protein
MKLASSGRSSRFEGRKLWASRDLGVSRSDSFFRFTEKRKYFRQTDVGFSPFITVAYKNKQIPGKPLSAFRQALLAKSRTQEYSCAGTIRRSTQHLEATSWLATRCCISAPLAAASPEGGDTVFKYNLAFACECGRLHATHVSITVSKTFATGATVSDVYKGEPLPPAVIKLLRTFAPCPLTSELVALDSADKLHLISTD